MAAKKKMTLTEYANAWLKSKGMSAKEAKANAGKYKSIAAAKKAGSLYYTDKNGKVMLAVYAEDLTKGVPGSQAPRTRPTPEKKSDIDVTALPGGGRLSDREIRDIAETAIRRSERGGTSGQMPKGGRGSEGAPVKRRYTYQDWKGMSRAERRLAGLPQSVLGGEVEFNRLMKGVTGKDKTVEGSAYSKGGAVRKRGYAKGGMVKANCGASTKPNRKARK